MERIEVNVETGEVQIIQLTPEEISVAQAQYAAWETAQQLVQQPVQPTLEQLQAELADITAKINSFTKG